MKAFVTGACGFVGGYLVRHLVRHGDTVTAAHLVDVPEKVPGCKYERLDIRDPEACTRVIGKAEPDVIYHLAGIAFVPEAEQNFEETLAINVAGAHNVLRVPHIAERRTRVVLVSSADVYGKIDGADLPLSEKQPIRPANNYSLSKAFAEMVAEKFASGSIIDPVIMRPFNHIGAGQNMRFVASNFAWQLARISKKLEKPVIRVGNLDVERDFSDVNDIVTGYRLAAERGTGTYNLCSGKPTSIRTILDLLVRISEVKISIEPDTVRMRAAEVPCVYGDYSRAKADLGWSPTVPLEQSLEAMYRYWLEKTV